MLFNIENIEFDDIWTGRPNVRLLVARLDKIHPVVSGNKLFKLHYFLQEAITSAHKTMLTFGGAYSNHLIATAFACKTLGLKSIGIVRGDPHERLSPTLQHCASLGMKLHFIPRTDYKNAADEIFIAQLKKEYGDFICVPEGGYDPKGAAGAALIMDLLRPLAPTHVCTATGTATTLAGLLLNSRDDLQVVSVPVIKNMSDIEARLMFLTNKSVYKNLAIFGDYHFGGYAKKTPGLLNFMNEFYRTNAVATDFVYTAKLMFAIMEKLAAGYFPRHSTLVCLHTGGLQGNQSLDEGSLIF